MNTIRWSRTLAAACTLGAALLAGAPASAQKTVDLTYSSWLPATHPLMADFMLPWGKEVEQATQGRVRINFLPKPATNPPGHYDAVRNGVVDLAFISHSYYPGRFDLMKLPTLPFSGTSALATSLAAWHLFDSYLRGANEHRGVKVLGIYGHGPGAVHTTSKVVEKIEDFDGLKIRVGGGMAADVAKVLNVNAVVKPAPDSYELLSTGVVDGVFFPTESLASFRLDDIVRHTTLFPGGLYADTHAVIMNEQAFQRLSESDQAALLKISGEHIARMAGKAWGDADMAGLKSMRAKGVTIHEASPQLVADVKKRTAPFEQAWLDAAKAKGIDGPKVLQAFHDDLKQIEAANR